MSTFRPDQDDLYEILEVQPDASDDDVKKAYRRLAQENHPDNNPGDAAAEERFKKISAAYDVLKDSTKRRDYDTMRRLMRSGAIRTGGGAGSGFTGTKDIRFEDLADMFGQGSVFQDLFGGMQDTGPKVKPRGPQRGGDIEAKVRLSFEDAMAGVTTQVSVPALEGCDRCEGSGAEPGTHPRPCPTCGGKGTTSDTQGFFAFSRTCSSCHGEGQVIDSPCKSCDGQGTLRRTKKVRVPIPPGVADGTRVRVKGRGEPGHNGGPSGDLYVKAVVDSSSVFERSGDDLKVTLDVPFETLVLGGKVSAPTLTGFVTLKIPAGTPNGRSFKVAGKGAPKPKGPGNGDLLVAVNVIVPKKLTDKAKAALRTYADLTGPSVGRDAIESDTGASTDGGDTGSDGGRRSRRGAKR